MNMLTLLKRGLIRTRDSRRKQVVAPGAIDSLESRLLLTAPTLTDSEQYMLELINRARANPEAEMNRLGIGLNSGLPAGTITPESKQPLAPQQQLTTVARAHSQDMLDWDYFSHTTVWNGTVFSQRIQSSGYIGLGVGQDIGFSIKKTEAAQTVYMDEIHNGLIRSSVDRKNIMDPTFEEVGVGAALGSIKYWGDQVTYPFTEMVTQDYGRRNLLPYITGVVYHDADSNNFYTIGESIRGGTVSAVNVSTGAVFSDTIGVSGAYGFVVPAGTYTVTATFILDGVTQNLLNPETVIVGTDNVKVDFKGGAGDSIPLVLSLASAVTTLNEHGATPTTTTMTVTRNGSPASSLTVTVVSADTTEVKVPATVVIPAGQLSATFTASAVNDGVIDGKQTATITATASAFAGASRVLTVTDKTTPVLPAAVQTVKTYRPKFTWTAVSNAATYELYVNNVTTNKFGVVNKKGIKGTSYTMTVNLPIGTFSVYVRGKTAAGLVSAWSPVAIWKIGVAPRITSPTGNGQPVRPKITWTFVAGAARYEILLKNLTTGMTEISKTNLLSTSYTPTADLLKSNNYRVWIRAFDSSGAATPWSLPVTFSIASDAATSPEMKNPLSPIGDPVLERLFASANLWLHEHLDEVPPAAVPKNTDPVESNLPLVEDALVGDSRRRFGDDKTFI